MREQQSQAELAALATKLIEVFPAKYGLGLRTPSGAKRGTVLIEEQPLYRDTPSSSSSEAVSGMDALPEETKKVILSLATESGSDRLEAAYTGDKLAMLQALRTNAIGLPDGGGAIYATACRANHSCKPNASLVTNEGATVRLIALRDIAPGEEVLVSYIGEGELLKPSGRRRELLRSTWHFECECPRCTGPDDTRGFVCGECGSGHVRAHSSDGSWLPCSTCGAPAPVEKLEAVEAEWRSHAGSLREGPLLGQIAAAMFGGLTAQAKEDLSSVPAPEGHWIASRLAGSAVEELLARGDGQGAAAAAELKYHFARRVLGGAASRAGASALGTKARVAELAGDSETAMHFYEEAISEASMIPRSADGVLESLLENQKQLAMSLQTSEKDAFAESVETAKVPVAA